MGFNYNNPSSNTIEILQNCLKVYKLKRVRNGDTVPEKLDAFTEVLSSSEQSSELLTTTTTATSTTNSTATATDSSTKDFPVHLIEAALNPQLCSFRFKLFQEYYHDELTYSVQIKKHDDIVREIFMNGTYNYTSNENYKKCLEEEKQFSTEKYSDTIKHVKQLAVSIAVADSMTEALGYSLQIKEIYQDVLNIMLEYSKIEDVCYWYKDIYQEEEDNHYEVGTEIWEVVNYFSNNAKKDFDKIRDAFNEVYKNYKENILPVDLKVQDYLLGNITKKKLLRLFERNTFLIGREDLMDLNADLNEAVRDLIELCQHVKRKIVDGYHKIINQKIPLLTTYNINDLILVKLAKSVEDSEMQELVESLKHGLDPSFLKLIRLTFERISAALNGVREEIIKPVEDLVDELDRFYNSLYRYEKSTIMDIDFFMWVNLKVQYFVWCHSNL